MPGLTLSVTLPFRSLTTPAQLQHRPALQPPGHLGQPNIRSIGTPAVPPQRRRPLPHHGGGRRATGSGLTRPSETVCKTFHSLLAQAKELCVGVDAESQAFRPAGDYRGTFH